LQIKFWMIFDRPVDRKKLRWLAVLMQGAGSAQMLLFVGLN
ncbi:uncharacterized protein METZ01_LOCUS463709, partial [marine metagenome]